MSIVPFWAQKHDLEGAHLVPVGEEWFPDNWRTADALQVSFNRRAE